MGKEAGITLRLQHTPLREALLQLAQQTGIHLTYAEDAVAPVTVTALIEAADAGHALRQMLQKTPLTYRLLTEDHIVIFPREQTSVIEGTITDRETGKPVADVSVFLANTTVGAQTDQRGAYRITSVPPGTYELVVRHIGYDLVKTPFQIVQPDTFRYDRSLSPRVLTLGTTEVFGAEEEVKPGSKKWKESLKQFTRYFLGESSNARACRIVNPEALTFYIDEEAGVFRASADSTLHVENRAFGYTLHVVLEKFRYVMEGEYVEYAILPKFELLASRDRYQASEWEKNRGKSYQGSVKHFLSTLVKGHTSRDKFQLFALEAPVEFFKRVPVEGDFYKPTYIGSLRGNDRVIEDQIRSQLKTSKEAVIGYEWALKEPDGELAQHIVAADSLSGLHRIVFDSYLGISYGQERSVMKLNKAYLLVDESGHVYTPYGFTVYGAWTQKAVGDLLPSDYTPDI
jgi:hypothetical protein